jgi:DNA-binding beta-propeller fold protein YncE
MATIRGDDWQTFGGTGSTTRKFRSPSGITVERTSDFHYRIWVNDQGNNRIQRFNEMTGADWRQCTSHNSPFGLLRGIALDRDGVPVIADSVIAELVVIGDYEVAYNCATLHIDATNTGRVGSFGPTDVFIDRQGQLYVADKSENVVHRFSGRETPFDDWQTVGSAGAGELQFGYPAGVWVDRQGRIYVADLLNHRIARMDNMDGDGWVTLGTRGAGELQFNSPSDIAVDDKGRIYVVDSNNYRIVRIDDMNGSGWISLGTRGSGEKQFRDAYAIWVVNKCANPDTLCDGASYQSPGRFP